MAIRERFLAGDFEPPPVPKTIPEALEVMTELVVPHERSFLGETTYQDFIGMSHHAMGRHMRNQWGFWAGEGELYERLCALGLSHADDMSGFLLCIWWCRLTGNDPLVCEELPVYYYPFFEALDENLF